MNVRKYTPTKCSLCSRELKTEFPGIRVEVKHLFVLTKVNGPILCGLEGEGISARSLGQVKRY